MKLSLVREFFFISFFAISHKRAADRKKYHGKGSSLSNRLSRLQCGGTWKNIRFYIRFVVPMSGQWMKWTDCEDQMSMSVCLCVVCMRGCSKPYSILTRFCWINDRLLLSNHTCNRFNHDSAINRTILDLFLVNL